MKEKPCSSPARPAGSAHAIGVRAARDGANIVVAAKTTEPHPKLPGTIYTAAEDMERAGGKALALPVDVRDDAGLRDAMAAAAESFGGIDILVNNASALSLTDTPSTPMKRYDLIMGINARGTFAATQAALPYLKEAANPHILTLSRARHESALVPGFDGLHDLENGHVDVRDRPRCGVCERWHRRQRPVAADLHLDRRAQAGAGHGLGDRAHAGDSGDCAHIILTRDAKACTGNLFIDEDVLAAEGIADLDKYRNHPDKPLAIDFFVDGYGE